MAVFYMKKKIKKRIVESVFLVWKIKNMRAISLGQWIKHFEDADVGDKSEISKYI